MSVQSDDAAVLSDDPKADKILNAAKVLFMERGYADTSMDQVAQTARVSKTTLYTRFPSKEALFGAAVSRECERSGLVFTPEDLIELPLEEALYRIARSFIEIMCSKEKIRAKQILVAEAGRFPELARVFFDAGPEKGHEALRRFFRLVKHRGLAQIADPDLTARMFDGITAGAFCWELELGLCDVPAPEERDTFARAAVKLFINGIGKR